MSLESELTAVLKTVSPRTFSDFASPGTETPYITFQQIGGESVVSLNGVIADKENAEMQINVWASSRTEAKTAIKAIEAALVAAPALTVRPLGAAASDFDADMKRYCSRQDFSIWADR